MPSEAAANADFSILRYAQVWEDADILLEALDIGPDDECLSIASAGDNALAMLAKGPKKVIGLDLNASQLACLELRVAAFRRLDQYEILELVGSVVSNRQQKLYQTLRADLSPEARNFWDARPIAPGIGHADEVGEILVAGDHVLKEYLFGRGDEETKVQIDGEIWHRTGDAGSLDEAGRLWLLGRCSAKVNDARGILYPFAVECVAKTFPFIRRAAFVLLENRRVLVIEAGGTANDQSQLAAAVEWAGVEEIRKLKRLPVDARHNAKINYPKLMQLLGRNNTIRTTDGLIIRELQVCSHSPVG